MGTYQKGQEQTNGTSKGESWDRLSKNINEDTSVFAEGPTELWVASQVSRSQQHGSEHQDQSQELLGAPLTAASQPEPDQNCWQDCLD